MSPDDKPDDDVINDDEELDSWYRAYLAEAARKISVAKSQKAR